VALRSPRCQPNGRVNSASGLQAACAAPAGLNHRSRPIEPDVMVTASPELSPVTVRLAKAPHSRPGIERRLSPEFDGADDLHTTSPPVDETKSWWGGVPRLLQKIVHNFVSFILGPVKSYETTVIGQPRLQGELVRNLLRISYSLDGQSQKRLRFRQDEESRGDLGLLASADLWLGSSGRGGADASPGKVPI